MSAGARTAKSREGKSSHKDKCTRRKLTQRHKDQWEKVEDNLHYDTKGRENEEKIQKFSENLKRPDFEGEHSDEGYRVDLFVEGKVIIDLKSVEKIIPIHSKQLLTYLRLTNTKLGFILNFGTAVMKDGINRIINGELDPDG